MPDYVVEELFLASRSEEADVVSLVFGCAKLLSFWEGDLIAVGGRTRHLFGEGISPPVFGKIESNSESAAGEAVELAELTGCY